MPKGVRAFDKTKDKGLMFFSSGSPRDCRLVFSAGISEILVSYFYLRKNFDAFHNEILPELKKRGGLFMTDSGGFSFINTTEFKPEMEKEKFWLPYLEEYVQWLWDWHEYIYVAANLDIEVFVGREIVDRWNRKYFKPLEKVMNIVYVAHEDRDGDYHDKTGMKRFKQYLEEHDYIGVNNDMKEQSLKFFTLAQIHKKRLHGFGWTSIPMLKNQPFFSVDSTTWLGGVRYGTTYLYDGKNFSVKDYKNKHVRKSRKILCREHGIDFKAMLEEDADAVNALNLRGWLGARQEFLRAANIKLHTKAIQHYAKS